MVTLENASFTYVLGSQTRAQRVRSILDMPSIFATQTLPHGASGWDRVQGFSLVGVEGPAAGLTWDSAAGRCSMGTHRSNDLVLSDPMISRFHCELHVDAANARIVDLGSKNGTTADGVRVRDAYVKQGSLIQLGQSILRFQLGGQTHPIGLSVRTEFGAVVGRSIVMRTMFDVLERAAPSDATILLEGETGTGKGVIAESVHDLSPRRVLPFSVVDCAALPANLLESELFGHERGAFTGAVARRAGAFEAAAGGTIFLDEIGELPLELQPKLLRALEERQFRRVGGNSVQNVDVRVIAATNRDLRTEVNEGRFRSDLYFRLALIRIKVPALREHLEDIPLLVERLLGNSRNAAPEIAASLRSPNFLATLQRATWPGNVRELRNHLESCLVLRQVLPFGESNRSDATPVGHPTSIMADASLSYHQARLQSQIAWEAQYLRALLAKHADNVEQAAEAAGISRAYMYRLLSRHGIRRAT
jgi:transcriptional regulator with PAS, ATPase and Fis domain